MNSNDFNLLLDAVQNRTLDNLDEYILAQISNKALVLLRSSPIQLDRDRLLNFLYTFDEEFQLDSLVEEEQISTEAPIYYVEATEKSDQEKMMDLINELRAEIQALKNSD